MQSAPLLLYCAYTLGLDTRCIQVVIFNAQDVYKLNWVTVKASLISELIAVSKDSMHPNEQTYIEVEIVEIEGLDIENP